MHKSFVISEIANFFNADTVGTKRERSLDKVKDSKSGKTTLINAEHLVYRVSVIYCVC